MANKATKKTITQQQAEQVAVEVVKKNNPYRDERGVRIQKYKRFKEGEDYEAVDAKDMVALTDNILGNLEQLRADIQIGRPRKYETVQEFLSIVEAYIQYIRDANIDGVRLVPDIEGLCAFMNISRDTLNDWEHTRLGLYSDTIKSVKNQLAFAKKQLALKGKIPPIVFATDFNNNHGYTQKQEVALSIPNPLGSDSDPATMAQKYQKALPETTIETE
jgi:hypothetical protein